MDNRPIGVLDSGLGGLTAVKELARTMPDENIVYFGDTGRVPYGTRGREIITEYSAQCVSFLETRDIKYLLVACGTISTVALPALRERFGVPMTGVVEPACRAAADATRNGRVGLIATSASIGTGAYERELARIAPDVAVTARACPLFVPIVESGRFLPGDPLPELLAREYLEPMKAAGVDTLVLGCTHYPLLRAVIQNEMGDGVKLVDVGAESARAAADYLRMNDMTGDGARREYYVTDSTESFARFGGMFLESDIKGRVARVDIERF